MENGSGIFAFQTLDIFSLGASQQIWMIFRRKNNSHHFPSDTAISRHSSAYAASPKLPSDTAISRHSSAYAVSPKLPSDTAISRHSSAYAASPTLPFHAATSSTNSATSRHTAADANSSALLNNNARKYFIFHL